MGLREGLPFRQRRLPSSGNESNNEKSPNSDNLNEFFPFLPCKHGWAGIRGKGLERDGPAGLTHDPVNNYQLLRPWAYDKPGNLDRKYPLIISLHGGTRSTDTFYTPCIVGKDAEMLKYPCFFFAPNSPSGWGGNSAMKVIGIIEDLIDTYRIDENRIYLMGFSMGGSGSYLFANTYHDFNGRLFAGIVRLAGQSQTVVGDAIAKKTSIWYHIGLEDVPIRADIARQAYQFIKDYPANSTATESITTDTVGKFPRTTRTLSKDGIEIMKISEYVGMGHESRTAFKDPALLEWLFRQSLDRP